MALGKNKTQASIKATDTIKRLEGLRKDATVVLSFRADPLLADRLEREAERQGLRTSQLIKSYVVQKLDE